MLLRNTYVDKRAVKKFGSNRNVIRVLKSNFHFLLVNGFFDNDRNLWLMECMIGGAIMVNKINPAEMASKASFIVENNVIAGAN